MGIFPTQEMLATSFVRAFPYPFSHMVTFASDADNMDSKHVNGIHELINNKLGLPITDSLWFTGDDSSNSLTIFAKTGMLNRSDSGVDHSPLYAMLLRNWHRGYTDTLHGWQSDSMPRVRQVFKTSIPLQGKVTKIELDENPSAVGQLDQQTHLRLYFDKKPPDDLWLLLKREDTDQVTVWDNRLLKQGLFVKKEHSQAPYIIEILTDVPPDMGSPLPARKVGLSNKLGLELHSEICQSGCNTHLFKVEKDGFSRLTVKYDLPWLRTWNIRPFVLTSHGGNTDVQDFFRSGFNYTIPKNHGSFFEKSTNTKATTINCLKGLADHLEEHAYHVDFLKELGVQFVWPYYSPFTHILWKRPTPALVSEFTSFYDLSRTVLLPFDYSTFPNFQRDLLKQNPLLKKVNLKELYCHDACDYGHGLMLGLLLATSITQVDAGLPVEHLWYTHFGTSSSEFHPTYDQPLRASAIKWFKILADRYYNFDGKIPNQRRIWVPSTATVARYRLLRDQIKSHITIDPATSLINIHSWHDQVTGLKLPDMDNGTRDLHGLTLYVPHSAAALVKVDGKTVTSLTRNPKDETGRESITIVDNNTPTLIFDPSLAQEQGRLLAHHAQYHLVQANKSDSFLVIAAPAKASEAWVEFKPNDISLWNTNYLNLIYRKRYSSGKTENTSFFLDLQMADGSNFRIVEGVNGKQLLAKQNGWCIPLSRNNHWVNQTLATFTMTFFMPAHQKIEDLSRFPLPHGQVSSLRIGLLHPQQGDAIEVKSLSALRASGNSAANNRGKLIAGRVMDAQYKPLADVIVKAHSNQKGVIQTSTDQDGYYFFYNRSCGDVLQITANQNRKLYAPGRGKRFRVVKDEADVDIFIP